MRCALYLKGKSTRFSSFSAECANCKVSLGCGFPRFPVAHQVHADEHADAAHVADDLVLLGEVFEPGAEVQAEFGRVLQQSLVLQDVEDGAGDGARDRIAAVSVEVLDARVVEALRHRLGRDHGRYWMAVSLW